METIKVKKKAGRISPTLMGDYDDTTTYRRLDWVYYGGTSYICKKNNTIGIKPSTLERWQKMIELPTELNMIFEEATTRENITSGEKLSVILGKIKRCISDIKAVAFTGSYNDLSDTPKSLKNPNALNINFNGASEASYDGSATKEINVTPAAINAVNTSTILTTKEQISANTNAANVTGALVAKSIMADITQINGSLVYQSGDVIGRDSIFMWIVGALGGVSTDIYTFIPINKPIVGNYIFNLVSLRIAQNGNAYTVSESELENIETQVINFSNSGLYLRIVKKDGWDCNTNDVVSIAIKFTLTVS